MTRADVFGDAYAELYDDVYIRKDYAGECAIIRDMIDRHAPSRSKRLLDLGCGTGGHAVRLAAQGFAVTGVDRSARMLREAREKADEAGVELTLHHGDLRTAALNETFDVAIMMFAVLCYQHDNDDVRAALQLARSHLLVNGLLIFDVWYGPAVLHLRPEARFQRIEHNGTTILRISDASLDTRHHCCDVSIQMWQLASETVKKHVDEKHRIRFFFPLELEYHLNSAGFNLLGLYAFPDVDSPPTDETWNVLGVAQARGQQTDQ